MSRPIQSTRTFRCTECCVVTFALLIAGLAIRATAAPPAVQSGDVDTAQSVIYVFIGKTGLGHEHAAEGKLVSGTVHLGAKESAGELVFDMKSFVTETPASRKHVGLEGEVGSSTADQVTASMKGHAVLNVAKFPQSRFVIDSALPGKQSGEFSLSGKLTLRGVTRPLQIDVTSEDAKGMVHLRGQFSLVQSQYGIKPYRKAFGTVGVADELKIWGELWLAK